MIERIDRRRHARWLPEGYTAAAEQSEAYGYRQQWRTQCEEIAVAIRKLSKLGLLYGNAATEVAVPAGAGQHVPHSAVNTILERFLIEHICRPDPMF